MKAVQTHENLKERKLRFNKHNLIREEEHFHPKLLKLRVNQTKITAFLEDKREISLPVSELAKKWRHYDLKAEQLKDYQIDPWGFRLHFPKADIDTSVLIFTGDNCGCC